MRKALLIGVGDYAVNLPKLHSPVNNVKELSKILRASSAGFFDQVSPLTDANSSGIRAAIDDFFKSSSENDFLLFYYSGHGLPDSEVTDGMFLAGIDTDKKSPDTDSVSKEFLFRRIYESSARNILIVCDACFSGRLTKGHRIKNVQKIGILTASNASSYAFEPTPAKKGELSFFTSKLVATIKYGITDCLDQFISIQGLYESIRTEASLSTKFPEPEFFNQKAAELWIAKNRNYLKIPDFVQRQLDSIDYAIQTQGVSQLKAWLNLAKDEKFIKLLRSVIAQYQKLIAGSLNDISEEPVASPATIPREANTITNDYLKWLIDDLGFIKLQGIHSTKSMRGVALDQIYVALRGDRSSSYEKLKAKDLSRNFHNGLNDSAMGDISEALRAEWQIDMLQEQPLSDSFVERDRSSNIDIPITLGQAFIDERFLVILGDPGCGKTTLVKWLCLNLARAYKEFLKKKKGLRVLVPEQQIDPYLDVQDIKFDLGPARFPILLSVSDYAQYYIERKKNERVGILDYLSSFRWQGKRPCDERGMQIDGQRLKELMISMLSRGEAVVIMDGMDEVNSFRSEIVDEIEQFIEKWIIGKGNKQKATLEDWFSNSQPPGLTGGNQIVITSRIVGYHLNPITKPVTHLTIEAMGKQAISRFCDMWISELYKTEYGNDVAHTPDQAQRTAERLKNSIFEDSRLLELASNPLLVTIIALVFHNNNEQLPTHRAALYEEALKTLVGTWKQTALSYNEVIYVLAAVAGKIHANSPKGLIKETELINVIEHSLASYRGIDRSMLPPRFAEEVEVFMEEIRNKVGIIAPRGQQAYGFIHLTFQEYLTARFLMNNKYHVSSTVIRYVDDPRWHVPILMTLGQISIDKSWGNEQFDDLLTDLLENRSKLDDHFPRTALIIAQAFLEISLDKINSSIIERVLIKLLNFYYQKQKIMKLPQLKAKIERAFSALIQNKKVKVAEELVIRLLQAPTPEFQHLVPVTAHILFVTGWISPAIAETLHGALKYDSAEWDWSVSAILLKLYSGAFIIAQPAQPVEPLSPNMEFKKRTKDLQEQIAKLESGNLQSEINSEISELEREELVQEVEQFLNQHYALRNILNEEKERILRLIMQSESGLLKKILTEKIIKLNYRIHRDYNRVAIAADQKTIKQLISIIDNGEMLIKLNGMLELVETQLNGLHRKIETAEKVHQSLAGTKGVKISIEAKDETRPLDYGTHYFRSWFPDSSHDNFEDFMILVVGLYSQADQPIPNPALSDNQLVLMKKKSDLKKRLQMILNGQERKSLQLEISEIKKDIEKGDVFYTAYRAKLPKFIAAQRFYEDALSKYEAQKSSGIIDYLAKKSRAAHKLLPSTIVNYCYYAIFIGGYKYQSQIEAVKAYEQVLVMLQKRDDEREIFFKKNAYEYYGKFGLDDTSYDAALALDTNSIRLNDFRTVKILNASLAPVFEHDLWYRACSLDGSILKALINNQTLPDLEKLVLSNEDLNVKAELTIALLFRLKDPSAIIRLLTDSPVRSIVLDKLEQVRSTLEDSVYCSRELIYKLLTEDEHTFSDNWEQLYLTLLSTMLLARKAPVPIKGTPLIEQVPEICNPIILADYWVSGSISSNENDSGLFKKMLEYIETCSTSIILRALLLVPNTPIFALKYNFSFVEEKWGANFISSKVFRKGEIPLDALSAITNFNTLIDSSSNKFIDLRRKLFAAVCKPVFQYSHPQQLELIIFCFRHNYFSDELRTVFPGTFFGDEFEVQTLSDLIFQISDPYFKARAYYQLLAHLQGDTEISHILLTIVNTIPDPFEQCQLYYLFYREQRFKFPSNMEEIYFEKLQSTHEPVKKIKACVDALKVISLLFQEMVNDLLLNAFEALESPTYKVLIADRLAKCHLNPALRTLLQNAASKAGNTELYVASLKLKGLQLLIDETKLVKEKANAVNWTPVLLSAAINDLLFYFHRLRHNQSTEELWMQLAIQPSENIVQNICERGIESLLELTPTVANVIFMLHEKGYTKVLLPLFPLLYAKNNSINSILTSWMLQKETILIDYAALYQAELLNRVTNTNIDGILRLRTARESLTNVRIGLVLNDGVTLISRQTPLKYNLSDVGLINVEKIIKAIPDDNKSNHVRQSPRCLLSDTLADDSDILLTCFQDQALHPLFLWLYYYDSRTEDLFLKFIHDRQLTDKEVQLLLELYVDAICTARSTNTVRYKHLLNILIEKYPYALKSLLISIDPVSDILNISDEVKAEDFKQATIAFERRRVSLFDIPPEPNSQAVDVGLHLAAGFYFPSSYGYGMVTDQTNFEVSYSDQRYEFFLKWFLALPIEPITQRLNSNVCVNALLIVISLWTNDRNIAILNINNLTGKLYEHLLRVICECGGIGRLCAINLMRFIKQHTPSGIKVLLNLLTGRSDDQQATINTLISIREVTDSLVELLCEKLEDDNELVVYIAIEILTNFASNNDIKPFYREKILSKFVELAGKDNLKKGVYAFSSNIGSIDHRLKSVFLDRLDEKVYASLIRVTDL